MIIRSEGEYLSFFHLSKFLSSIMPDFLGKDDCRRAGGVPALGFHRGVSHTPLKRPDRGERSFDGQVPVGRMRYAPTSMALPAFEFRRGVSNTPLFLFREANFRSAIVLPPFREANFRPATVLTF